MSPTTPARELVLGYSPCPNDTFIFHALVHGLVDTPGVLWRPRLEDVETLNRLAYQRRIPVTKLSFHAYGYLRETYALLRSGAALGRGCGPLLVARDAEVAGALPAARLAVPGQLTSAALLLRLYAPELLARQFIEMPFDRILPSLARGEVDAGLIIHESRFTYEDYGLIALVDLGEWWERESGSPIPLGGIVADRQLGSNLVGSIEAALRSSVQYARRHPESSADYVCEHAQELSETVTRAHIELYVNDFTVDLGDEGVEAVQLLFRAAEERGILSPYEGTLFVGA